MASDVAGDPEQPGPRRPEVGAVPRRALDRFEEDVGRQVGGEVRVGHAARDEPLHRLDVLAVEGLERVGVGADRGQGVGRSHTRSLPMGCRALPANLRQQQGRVPELVPEVAVGHRRVVRRPRELRSGHGLHEHQV